MVSVCGIDFSILSEEREGNFCFFVVVKLEAEKGHAFGFAGEKVPCSDAMEFRFCIPRLNLIVRVVFLLCCTVPYYTVVLRRNVQYQ
jgi:hypothetical protein